MKNNIVKAVYFAACLFAILCNSLGYIDGMLWARAAALPAIVYYYLRVSNFKINCLISGIFIFCYIGEIYSLISPNDHLIIDVICFLLAYLTLIVYLVPNFSKINWKHPYNLVLIAFASTSLLIIGYLVLTLKLEKIDISTSILIFYGIVVSILLFISIMEYFRKNTLVSVHLLIACIFFYFSDCFYIINNFYLAFFVFNFVQIVMQVLSYYFLVNFFILNEQKRKVSH